MLDKMKEMWELKKKMDTLKKELDSILLESEDNLVKIGISGSQEVKSVTVKGELSAIDKAKLEASLLETINRAVKQAQKAAVEKMGVIGGAAGGLPGMS
ncbi:MAG: YbaB/EbfC family nucleoid-associated protein [bacterium]